MIAVGVGVSPVLLTAAGVSLTPVNVVIQLGDSNTDGARNSISEIPNGYYTTDANTYIWDAAALSGAGAAIRTLTAPTYSTATMTIATPGVVTWTAHGLVADTPIILTTTGALPTGLTACVPGTSGGTRYYVRNPATNTFELSATRGGASIATSGSQSGVHTAFANPGLGQQPGGATYVDPLYPLSVGNAFEFNKHWRTQNATSPLYFFHMARGGSRFSDANTTFGRADNWKETLSDGAYNEMKVQWAAFVAALTALGKTPNIVVVRMCMGGNTVSDLTESNAFQTDMTSFLAQFRTDIIGNAKFVWESIGVAQQPLMANYTTVRAKGEAFVLADTAKREFLCSDGFVPINGSEVHWGVSSFIASGEQLAYHALGWWYPQKERTFLSGNQPTHEYRPGDFRNIAGATAFTLTGGNVQTALDLTGGGTPAGQATDSKRPIVSVTNTPTGYGARYATGDGVDDILVTTSSLGLSAGSYGAFAAVASVTVTNLDALWAEASSTSGTPFIEPMKQDASGNMTFLSRNDATLITGATTIASTAFNGTMNALAVTDNSATITGYVNGTAGTPLTYNGGTRGTTTVNRFSLFGLQSNGAEGQQINAKLGIIWFTTSVPDATYLTNAWAYMQRRWGTV